MPKSKLSRTSPKPGAGPSTTPDLPLGVSSPRRPLLKQIPLLSTSATATSAFAVQSHESNGHSTLTISAATVNGGGPNESPKSQAQVALAEKIKDLLRLAQEQGYLTYGDINDALPPAMLRADDLDEIYVKLRSLEVEIVDQAEVDRVKVPEPDGDDERGRLDILDDPVRMYLKQMGQVPLLTREQEVEISKRIEAAENDVKLAIYSFGFAAKEHIALAEKLLCEPPKERFDRVILDQKIDSRESHLRALRKLVKSVRLLDQQADQLYAQWQGASSRTA